MKQITGLQDFKRPWARATKGIMSPNCLHCETSVGFVIPKGQKKGKRKGIQYTLTAYRWSEEAMKKFPLSGGISKP